MTNTAITQLKEEITNLTKVLEEFSIVHQYDEATIIYPTSYTKEVLENGFERLNICSQSFSVSKKQNFNYQSQDLTKELDALDKAVLGLKERLRWVYCQLDSIKDNTD